MKYLESYDPESEGEIDAFEEFMRKAVAEREINKVLTLTSPKPQKTLYKPAVKSKPLGDIAKIIAYDPSTSTILISLNGNKYKYSNVSPFIKGDMEIDIKKNRKGNFFKTINFLSNSTTD